MAYIKRLKDKLNNIVYPQTSVEAVYDGDTRLDYILDDKVDKVTGKGLSTNDYTNADKTKLAGIEAGAEANAVDSVNGKTGAVTLNTSDLTNNSGYITNAVSDLTNYYLKSETYTKAEVTALIAAINQFTYTVASTLPTASASTMYKLYLVPNDDPGVQNVYDEYITIDNGVEAATRYTFEKIGTTAVDLSDYYTKSEVNTAVNAKYTKPASGIPSTDMSSAVQTSLGLADSALQSVPNTYRTASAQDTIDAGKQNAVHVYILEAGD